MAYEGIEIWREGGRGRDLQVAIHEAGHAVVAVALGWSLHTVEMLSDGGVCRIGEPPQAVRVWRSAGRSGIFRRTTEEERQTEAQRLAERQSAIIYCAGIAAQGIQLAHDDDLGWFITFGEAMDQPDYHAVLAWAGLPPHPDVFEGRPFEKVEAVYRRAYKLLVNNPAHRALAVLTDILLERRTIPGPEAEALIRKARRLRY